MRIGWLRVLLLSACLVLTTAGVAWAHVVVSPKEAPAGSYQKFSISVPTEKDIPTTEVRVEVPEGFTVTGVQPVPGWQSEFERDGGVITAIRWSGGEIAPEEFQEFAFQARTPEDTGEFSWRAFQTYEDGSVVEWTGEPDSEEPASVVKIVSGNAQADEHGAENQGDEQQGSGFTPVAAYGGLGLGALALVVALLALRGASRKG
jgi:uncharacterized protein YcnI